MNKHRENGRAKSLLNGRKPALWIVPVAFLACVAIAVCFLTMWKKKSFDPVGTWALSTIIRSDEEVSAGYLVQYGVGLETFTLYGDGTGSWVTESINPGKSVHTMAFTYTRRGNVLTFVNLDQSSTFEVTYDPQEGTLSNEASYMTYIYSRVGETAAPDPTPDQLSGVWKTDGTNFGEDQILFGSLVLDRDGRAMLDLSTGGGSALQKEYTFFLDKQYLCLSTDEGSVYGLYDPEIDTIFLPFKDSRSLPFTRADDPIPTASVSPNAQSLPGIWELAWMESTIPDEAWAEKRKEGPSARDPYIGTFQEEYERFCSGEKFYTMILYESGNGDLIIQDVFSTSYVSVGCDEDRQTIGQRLFELELSYRFDGEQLILDGDGFRLGFKRFDFIAPSSAMARQHDSSDPAEAASESEKSDDLSKEQADAFLSGLSVEFEDGAPYGCDLVCYIDGFGTCLNIGDPDAYRSASLRFEPTEERVEPIYPHFTYAEILSAGNREYYLRNIRVFKTESGDSMQKHETWDMDRPDADASIFVPIDPSLMERNGACPERACVIKSFDAENRTVTVSFASVDMPENDYDLRTVNYDDIQKETHTLRISDDTMLTLIPDYEALVKPDRFFRYLEEFGWYLDRADGDYRGIGFWIGCDDNTILYLCEVFEE